MYVSADCLQSQSTKLPSWQYKRFRKSSSEPLDDTKRSFLSSLLRVILNKLKWDEDADPEDMDEDDKAAFEELRRVSSFETVLE